MYNTGGLMEKIQIEIESDAELYAKANTLIEDIFRFKKEKCEDLSLLESIIEYGFQYDIPIQELGNVIADHKDYLIMFRKQLIKDKYIKEDELMGLEEHEYTDEEW